ncbi:olfactory receptor 51G2-like [Mauremys reevesii]|uniref:olfactory receptor 51G2-like n=1 Tax=Mauremys reevesii TaxID=260615 RepID=UPI0019400031|nr:olfactory receptor 51G2-like [Mauremys reevesii]
MPTILGIFLFNSREISLDACFAQLFFIHSLTKIESSMLLLMAFDRFIAIRDPMRYASILTLPRIGKMGLVCVLRGVAVMLPLPFVLKQFRYCRSNVLSHSYCLHQDVMKMACSDIRVNYIYGSFITFFTVGLDSLLIFLSYVMILKTVLSITSHAECFRALNTCVSHLCAVLLFYTPEIGLPVIHRFGIISSHFASESSELHSPAGPAPDEPNRVQRENQTSSCEDNQGIRQVKGQFITRLQRGYVGDEIYGPAIPSWTFTSETT